MTFTSQPLFPGDLFESAAKFAADADQQLARLVDANARSKARETLWNEAVDLGWSMVLVAEEDGGAGGGIMELAALLEGCGRSALPMPVLAPFGIAPMIIAASESSRRKEILQEIASAQILIWPVLEPLVFHDSKKPRRGGVVGSKHDRGLVLNGEILGVEAVPSATHILLACPVETGTGLDSVLCLIPATAQDLAKRDLLRMDGRPSADLRFTNLGVEPYNILAKGDGVRASVGEVRDAAAALAAVEAVAAAGALLEQTITYLRGRVQFGVALSTFQTLRHDVAEMYVAYENLRALVHRVLSKMAVAPSFACEDVALLKVRLADVARPIAHIAIQLHGGMGITEELPATRLAKRLLMADFEYGDGAYHAQRLLNSRAAGAAYAAAAFS